MNGIYWLVVAILMLIGFALVIPALWKKKTDKATEVDQLNINVARDRAAELKRQLANNSLTQVQYDEQYSELELTLADDLDIQQHSANESSQGKWIIPVIVVTLPLFSILTYFQLGEPNALIKAETQLQQQAEPNQLDVNGMVEGLAARLKDDPDNGEGWIMLGRSYKYLEKYPQAIQAFEKAIAILGERSDVVLQYADALAMTNGGKLAGKPAELIFKVIQKSPDDVTGLWLAGIAKTELGEFAQAMQYLTKLETLLEPGSESYQQLQKLISSIQEKKTGAPTQKAKHINPVSIDVNVSVADSVINRIKQEDTVFIYARALTGPPMPLAIERKQVTDLPISITLDDSMAMMPAMKLSNFEQVTVLARISKSGTAMQQKGDFIGTATVQKLVGKVAVNVVINEEIK